MDQEYCKIDDEHRYFIEKLDGVTPDEMRKVNTNPGYEHVNVHVIFDINMDRKFTRKARLVYNSHTSDANTFPNTVPASVQSFSLSFE